MRRLPGRLSASTPPTRWASTSCCWNLTVLPTRGKLGANAILGVSLAGCQSRRRSALGLPLFRYLGGVNAKELPVPMMNILNGGKHADNTVDIQEFMIMPVGTPSFSEALRMGAEVFHSLKAVLKEAGLNTAVGDEGGFAPNLKTNEETIEVILKAVEKAGYKPGDDVVLALDVASTELLGDGRYVFAGEGVTRDTGEMIDLYEKLINAYPVYSIEDPLSEEEWDGWLELTKRLGKRSSLSGMTSLSPIPRGWPRGLRWASPTPS